MNRLQGIARLSPDDVPSGGAAPCRLYAVDESAPAPLDVFAMLDLPVAMAGGFAAATPPAPDPLGCAVETWLIGPGDPTSAEAPGVASRVLCRWRAATATAVGAELGRIPALNAEVWDAAVLDLSHGAGDSGEAGTLPINVVVEDSRTDGTVIRSIFPYDRHAPSLIRHRVTLVRVALSLDGRHLLAFYYAPDTESVRRAQRDGSVCPGSVRACVPTEGFESP